MTTACAGCQELQLANTLPQCVQISPDRKLTIYVHQHMNAVRLQHCSSACQQLEVLVVTLPTLSFMFLIKEAVAQDLLG